MKRLIGVICAVVAILSAYGVVKDFWQDKPADLIVWGLAVQGSILGPLLVWHLWARD